MFGARPENFVDILTMSVLLSLHASFDNLHYFTIIDNRTGVSLHVYWMFGKETLILSIFSRAIVIL